MKRFFRNNGLSLALFGLFSLFVTGMAISGYHDFNDDERQHGQHRIPFTRYLVSGHFLESLFENWESEFLQMGAYIFLTVFLYQKGSAESKDPDHPAADPASISAGATPAPVRHGGWALKIYQHSLGIAFFVLFLLSFTGHVFAGGQHYNEERISHGLPELPLGEYIQTYRFWFESFQNWQSEFLAVLAIVLLSVWLREKGSPESKAVSAPHTQTGK